MFELIGRVAVLIAFGSESSCCGFWCIICCLSSKPFCISHIWTSLQRSKNWLMTFWCLAAVSASSCCSLFEVTSARCLSIPFRCLVCIEISSLLRYENQSKLSYSRFFSLYMLDGTSTIKLLWSNKTSSLVRLPIFVLICDILLSLRIRILNVEPRLVTVGGTILRLFWLAERYSILPSL